jgi:hypothetical protein
MAITKCAFYGERDRHRLCDKGDLPTLRCDIEAPWVELSRSGCRDAAGRAVNRVDGALDGLIDIAGDAAQLAGVKSMISAEH